MKTDITEILAAMADDDGGLIEVYVGPVDDGVWRRILPALIEAGYGVSVKSVSSDEEVAIDGQLIDGDLFDGEGWGRYSLRIPVGRQTWTGFLHSAESVDLQGDPRDVTSPGDIDDIVALMRLLHDVTEQRVILVRETLDYQAAVPYLTVP